MQEKSARETFNLQEKHLICERHMSDKHCENQFTIMPDLETDYVKIKQTCWYLSCLI